MKNDLDRTFGQIFDGDVASFRAQLIEIQRHQADREDAERWVRQLRFLDVEGLFSLQSKFAEQCRQQRVRPTAPIPVRERCYDDGCDPYIAVSWRWPNRSNVPATNNQTVLTFDYMIERRNAEPHKSDFPDHYLERVIMFAQAMEITKIWIDKECIYQRKGDELTFPHDPQRGVQIMDVVYGESAASVGLLTTALTSQDEIHTLTGLFSGSFLVDPEDHDNPRLFSGVNAQRVQMLLLKIFSDPRWSRGWIFQEDHLASARMTLLIPYNKDLHVKRHHGQYDFGDIPGELQVNLAEFKQAVTIFCLASPEDEHTWPNTEFLSKAKQYKIWNKHLYTIKPYHRDQPLLTNGMESVRRGVKLNADGNHRSISYYPTMTISVLDDICNRLLEKEEDRIAILANAMRFSKRLDIRPESPIVKSGTYSLSTALLALILMNGEILLNSDVDDRISSADLMRHTLQSYLRHHEYMVNAPSCKLEQSFINRCRFKSPTITSRGIETQGFLFKLLCIDHKRQGGGLINPLEFNERQQNDILRLAQHPRSACIPRGRKLNLMAEKAIQIIITKLEEAWPNGRLAEYLEDHLELDQRPHDVKPSTPYILDMMAAVAQALLDGRELRLARLASAQADLGPSAIFIAPETNVWNMDMQPPNIFTSWDGGRNAYDRERFVSFEAMRHSIRRRHKDILHIYAWVNGVWDVRGEQMSTYYFPLPGITENPNDEAGKRKPKRTRSYREDESETEEAQRDYSRRRL